VASISDFSNFVLNEEKVGSFYNDELNPKFWDKYKNKSGGTEWVFDRIVRKKLLKIADDFYEKYKDLLGDLPIEDVQLTGSLANFNYTDKSDLDVHVLVDFNKIKSKRDILKAAVDGVRFVWNLRHDVVIRNHDIFFFARECKGDV
jgi:predicted nucleotidyltransferase